MALTGQNQHFLLLGTFSYPYRFSPLLAQCKPWEKRVPVQPHAAEVINTPADNRKPWVGIPASAMARGLKKDQLKNYISSTKQCIFDPSATHRCSKVFALPNRTCSLQASFRMHFYEAGHLLQTCFVTQTFRAIFQERCLQSWTRPRSIFLQATEIQQSQGWILVASLATNARHSPRT